MAADFNALNISRMKLLFFSIFLSIFHFPYPNPFSPGESSIYRFNYENVLGTSFELKVVSNSEQAADYAEQVALADIDRLNNILSTYNPSSEVSLWQKTDDIEVKVSPELFEVLSMFDYWNQKTSGAVNASAGTAINLWKVAERNQIMPGNNELNAAVKAMNEPLWQLNPETGTAKKLTNKPLVLNSFVKSYIIKKVSERIMGIPGVTGAVVNIGGDMVVAGNQTETILISDPMADAENDFPVSVVQLQGQAIATSGNYRRGFQIGNQRFSHIIDPRTAYPASHIRSATVVAANATDAGALATAFNVLEIIESQSLAASIPGVEYQIITSDGKEVVSSGWTSMEIPDHGNTPFYKPGENKLTIEFELATFEGRFRRPFVAVWVENKKKETVKNIALWYNKPRWLPDLKRWYSKNQSLMQDSAAKASISSATRSAGKYTLSWNGLDDSGKPVPAGKYTVYIEAAREHGTYQLIKQEIDWNGKPAHFDMEGGIEITSSSLTISK